MGGFLHHLGDSTLKLPRNDVLIQVMLASLTLAVLLAVFGKLADSVTPRRLYALGAALFTISVYPAFTVLQTRDPVLIGLTLVLVPGVVHAVLYGPQGTFYAQLSLSPVRLRYTGMSFVYQFSGIYASGLTPLIITALLETGGGAPWLAGGYLVLTGVIGVTATLLIRPRDLH